MKLFSDEEHNALMHCNGMPEALIAVIGLLRYNGISVMCLCAVM